MLLNLFGFWVIGLPVCWWLGFGAGLGPEGVWWGLALGIGGGGGGQEGVEVQGLGGGELVPGRGGGVGAVVDVNVDQRRRTVTSVRPMPCEVMVTRML